MRDIKQQAGDIAAYAAIFASARAREPRHRRKDTRLIGFA